MHLEYLIHYGNSRWRHSQPKNSAQQLSLAALRRGVRVFHLAPESNTPGVVSLRPGFRLFHSSTPLEPTRLQNELLADWEMRPDNTLVMSSYASPSCARLLGHFHDQGFFCVHRQVDWFPDDPRLGSYSSEALRQLCAVADLITVSHPQLRELLPESRGPVIDLRNGLDTRAFGAWSRAQPVPRDLRRGDLTLGFWGTFWGERLDWELICQLAEREPGWQWNLIGDAIYLPRVGPLPPNLHFLGARHPRQLAAYGQNFEVALVPFRQDQDLARLANPIKALEYLACGCPVLSPPNPSLSGYPGIFSYRSLSEAASQIGAAAATRLSAEQRQLLCDSHSWERRWDELVAAVGF